MAVAQGYGKTVTSGSVFAYDVADTRNSYIGQPTTNLANTNTARTMFLHYGSHAMTFADAPEKGDGWKKVTITTVNGGNDRLSQFPYITSAIGQRTYSVEYDVGTLNTYKWKLDGSGGYEIIPVTGKGKFQFTVTHGSVGSFALFLINQTPATGLNDTVYYRYYQVENKPTATPFTPDTRSVTQGLLPLVGNSSLDLTNVSFDSNAQISLDGSSDYVKIAQNSNFYTNEWAWEMVVKFTANTGTYQGLVWAEGDTGGGSGLQYLLTLYNHSYFHYRINNATTGWTNTDTSAIDFIPSNYNHIVFQFKNGTTTIYVNGKVFHTDSTRGAYSGGTNSPMFIGARNDGAFSSAITVPVCRLYNKVLSADEVKQNFDFYDARFGIEIESTYYFAVSNRFTRLKRHYLDGYDVEQLIQGKTMASTTPAYILYQKPDASNGIIGNYTQLASDPIGTPSRITVLGSQTSYSNGRYLTTVNVHKSKKGGRLTFEFPNGGTTQYGEAFYKTIVTPYVP